MKGFNKFKSTLDNHDFMTEEHISKFLRNHKTGPDNYGRHALASILSEYDNPTVVDAACGTCVNWEVFKDRRIQCQYTGIDRTEGMLRESARRYGSEITLQKGYVQDLPLEDASQDIVIMRHILEHLQEGYDPAIREGLRVAAKELVIVFFLDPSDKEEDLIEESDPDENGCTYFWNTYSWPKFISYINENFDVQIKVNHIRTPGAAHADTIVRLIK